MNVSAPSTVHSTQEADLSATLRTPPAGNTDPLLRIMTLLEMTPIPTGTTIKAAPAGPISTETPLETTSTVPEATSTAQEATSMDLEATSMEPEPTSMDLEATNTVEIQHPEAEATSTVEEDRQGPTSTEENHHPEATSTAAEDHPEQIQEQTNTEAFTATTELTPVGSTVEVRLLHPVQERTSSMAEVPAASSMEEVRPEAVTTVPVGPAPIRPRDDQEAVTRSLTLPEAPSGLKWAESDAFRSALPKKETG